MLSPGRRASCRPRVRAGFTRAAPAASKPPSLPSANPKAHKPRPTGGTLNEATHLLKNFANGEYADTADGRSYDLVNPATGEAFATSPASGGADVDRAFDAAEKAFETWRDSTPSERQLALLRLADKIEKSAEELVRAESENTGKPVGLTTEEEAPAMVDQIRFSPAPPASSKASRPASTWPA
jgi:hypothetical protein